MIALIGIEQHVESASQVFVEDWFHPCKFMPFRINEISDFRYK